MNATGTEARVCQDVAERQQLGVKKYGVTVEENPLTLRDWLRHAYEECLDQAVYLRRAIEEMGVDAKSHEAVQVIDSKSGQAQMPVKSTSQTNAELASELLIRDEIIAWDTRTMRRLWLGLSEATAILRDMSNNLPQVYCDNMRHGSEEEHKANGQCPAEERWDAIVERVKAFVEKVDKEKGVK